MRKSIADATKSERLTNQAQFPDWKVERNVLKHEGTCSVGAGRCIALVHGAGGLCVPFEGGFRESNGSSGLHLLRIDRWTMNDVFYSDTLLGIIRVLPDLAFVQERFDSLDAHHRLQHICDHARQSIERTAHDEKDCQRREGHRGRQLFVLQLCVGSEGHHCDQNGRPEPEQRKESVDYVKANEATQLLITDIYIRW